MISVWLALCTLGKFSVMFFLSSADFILPKSNVFEKFFRNTIKVSNSLDTDQAPRFAGPDSVPNCLQKMSADDTRR